MRLFNLNDRYNIVCESVSRRGGFKHVATLIDNGDEADSTKCLYINRTWERFTYESVLRKLVSQCFTGTELETFQDKLGL